MITKFKQEGIDFDYNCQIIEQYDAWKANNPD